MKELLFFRALSFDLPFWRCVYQTPTLYPRQRQLGFCSGSVKLFFILVSWAEELAGSITPTPCGDDESRTCCLYDAHAPNMFGAVGGECMAYRWG